MTRLPTTSNSLPSADPSQRTSAVRAINGAGLTGIVETAATADDQLATVEQRGELALYGRHGSERRNRCRRGLRDDRWLRGARHCRAAARARMQPTAASKHIISAR